MSVKEILHRLDYYCNRQVTIEGVAATDFACAWIAESMDRVDDRRFSILLDVSQRSREQLLAVECLVGGPIAFARPAIVRGVVVNDDDGQFGAKLTAIESFEVNTPEGLMVGVAC